MTRNEINQAGKHNSLGFHKAHLFQHRMTLKLCKQLRYECGRDWNAADDARIAVTSGKLLQLLLEGTQLLLQLHLLLGKLFLLLLHVSCDRHPHPASEYLLFHSTCCDDGPVHGVPTQVHGVHADGPAGEMLLETLVQRNVLRCSASLVQRGWFQGGAQAFVPRTRRGIDCDGAIFELSGRLASLRKVKYTGKSCTIAFAIAVLSPPLAVPV